MKPPSPRLLKRRSILISTTAALLSAESWASVKPTAAIKLPIRVGQVGTGHSHAAGKWETINRFSELFEVVGLAESNPSLRHDAEKKAAYREAKWISEAELLDKASLVVVETEVPNLVATARRALNAGKHLHLDKPGGTNLA